MAVEDEATAGVKRGREEEDADDQGVAKEARVAPVDGQKADGAADGAADGGEGGGEDDAAPAEEQPSAVDQLAEALEMLAPVVTKRLDTLHASGLVLEEEIDATTLLLLGEFTPKVAVEIIDSMTKENLEVRRPNQTTLHADRARIRRPSNPAPRLF